MKKALLISTLLLSLSAYGGTRDYDLIISQLLKFQATKGVVHSILNKEERNLTVMYENGISAYIYIDAVEGEQYKGHYLIITYFIPNLNLFVENKDDKKEILKFIKQEVGKNDYTLDYFFNEAFEIAINHVDESSKKENNGFRMFAVNPDWASELEVRVLEIRDSQYVVNIYYNISL